MVPPCLSLCWSILRLQRNVPRGGCAQCRLLSARAAASSFPPSPSPSPSPLAYPSRNLQWPSQQVYCRVNGFMRNSIPPSAPARPQSPVNGHSAQCCCTPLNHQRSAMKSYIAHQMFSSSFSSTSPEADMLYLLLYAKTHSNAFSTKVKAANTVRILRKPACRKYHYHLPASSAPFQATKKLAEMVIKDHFDRK